MSLVLMSALIVSLILAVPITALETEITLSVADGDRTADIQAAIANIADGGTIYFGAGTYHANISIINPGKSFSLVSLDSAAILDGGEAGSVIRIRDTGAHTVTVDGFTITNGKAKNGGGIYLDNADAVVTNCRIYGNTATDSASGGVSSATARGGGMCIEYASPVVTNCIFTENTVFADAQGESLSTATAVGGAVYTVGGILDQSWPVFTNCTFAGNEAWASASAAGYYLLRRFLPGIEVTTFLGGGMYNGTQAHTLITNCIFWDNDSATVLFDTETEIWSVNMAHTSLTYSNVQGGYPGEGNLNADPLFGADFSLLPTSPCIDTGIDASGTSLGRVSNDIRGADRPFSASFDMGAYEHVSLSVVLTLTLDPLAGSVTCTAAAAGGYGAYTYDWDLDGDGTYEALDGGTLQVITPYTGGKGTVSVRVTDENFCTADDSKAYHIENMPFSPGMTQPLAITQVGKVLNTWTEILAQIPPEPTEVMNGLIGRIQTHMASAMQLTNPIYASGQLFQAVALMEELAAMLE
ncbi:MAG: right-handed parallel beta-helix repeat-containing protein [Candidatus Methanofastidiosa archaeon]|nr:right-handed parallel beta-helix repeat-containing protein [Candidatus Methanofastidiosa archaeon]